MPSPRFRPGLVPPTAHVEIAWLAFRGDDLLMRDPSGGRLEVPVAAELSALGVRAVRVQPLGELDGRPCCSAELAADAAAPEGYTYASLWRLYGLVDQAIFDAAGTAFQVQYWDRSHQHCGMCGGLLEVKTEERAKRCARCKHDYFPKITPATIVLVDDGPRILMTRQARFPAGMYGLVAGFVDPGETLEACAIREVREETGLEIEDVTYFGSQPWPFPHQLMIGFTARYAGGELRVEPRELEDARWFHRDALPMLPPPISIARRLVDAWLTRTLQ